MKDEPRLIVFYNSKAVCLTDGMQLTCRMGSSGGEAGQARL